MNNDYIVIRGARENNLKNIDLKIPKNKLVVMTGLSGSGKSSLAFDTIYAEGQRRYVESISAYARQFLNNVDKPDVDSIDGLSPAISIDQKTTNKNPRSTVGTVTEIYDYFRLLYARIGRAYCPIHGIEIKSQTITQMCERLFELPVDTKIIIMSPAAHMQKGRHEKLFELLQKEGLTKVRVDGFVYDLDEEIILDKNIKHNIDAIIDRVKIREESRSRIYDSLELACKLGDGKVVVDVTKDVNGEEKHEELVFSEHLACPECGFSIPKLEPVLFSFNSPQGACPECKGLGFLQQLSLELLVPDPTKTIRQGAIRYVKNFVDTENIEWQQFKTLLDYYNISEDVPFNELTEEQVDIILHGSKEPIQYEINSSGGLHYKRNAFIEGLADLIERRYKETSSSFSREYYNSYLSDCTCPTCQGRKLNEHALAVKIGGLDIDEITSLSISELVDFIKNLDLTETERKIGNLVLKEIISRLNFLNNVGLEYLTLSRSASTLSGGESQRIRLATQIGSQLSGVLYVLDEPSIGLHQRDNDRLIAALKNMRDLGNSLIVVEHDEEIMRKCDYLIDIGPGAGINGGEVVACGSIEDVCNNENSITGDYLSGRKKIEIPKFERSGNGKFLKIVGARENNLKGIDVEIPLGKLVVVTGVSGSGKSSLINDILVKTLQKEVNKSKIIPGKCDRIEGIENIDKIIEIDQSPIGRTPRSNPATYTGVFDHIRDLFASTMEAKERGYNKGRFSFNVKGGRCEKCWGDGVIRIEMHFLPDVFVPCEECHGTRYNSETLEIKYKDKNIYDVLEMTVEEGVKFFENIPQIKTKLDILNQVGLSYIKLGQNAVTLSGGEAQRVKLASELYKKISTKAIYILDEPTTGLHSDDVNKLIKVLNHIVDEGGSVIVIEHNLDVIKQADYIIDLGPDGGVFGGEVVVSGSKQDVIDCDRSYTGKYLKKVLEKDR
ncbi:MAG: excinuclease ABC subunit UvrA [Bacilli bacterium]|nr:excinuclease ABC subunit UvrA [Bacilli bacterium]